MKENKKRTASSRQPLWLAGALVVMLACGGCGASAPSDPDAGRSALQAALEAWKGGENSDTLAKRSPPIYITDGDWMSGLRLSSYQAENNGNLVGSDVNFKVVLELKTTKGEVVKRNAVYAVTTHPQLLIQRQDSL